jgi:hypothetical protein
MIYLRSGLHKKRRAIVVKSLIMLYLTEAV